MTEMKKKRTWIIVAIMIVIVNALVPVQSTVAKPMCQIDCEAVGRVVKIMALAGNVAGISKDAITITSDPMLSGFLLRKLNTAGLSYANIEDVTADLDKMGWPSTTKTEGTTWRIPGDWKNPCPPPGDAGGQPAPAPQIVPVTVAAPQAKPITLPTTAPASGGLLSVIWIPVAILVVVLVVVRRRTA
jgi:hypothetical protein